MRPRGLAAAALGVAALAGCGTPGAASPPAAPPTAAVPAASPSAAWTPPPDPARTARPLGKPGRWRVTTYYTAVEKYHGGEPKAVRGCPRLHCKWGSTPLGSYPEDFLKIIRVEGSGRITEGPRAGRYLNWSSSTGWWLDTTPRDSGARPLRAWESAAADRDVLARGQRFTIAGCGRNGTGKTVPAPVCTLFQRATWTVTDVFRPGWGGEHHADLYLGEETGPGFTRSPQYTTLHGATLVVA
ncbi:hypothetical protein [Actinomadura flavalba]|uniref:hypothetical protein n=1 Tax=Actinomadura flavalba TaxID=1120938 RepID=UPI00037D37BA|nr:hypothetical protein [Actinomadura flavalba]